MTPLSADLARLVQQLRNDSNDEAADLILDLTERAEAAEQAIHKERMLTDEVVGRLQELQAMYNTQARTIIELQDDVCKLLSGTET